MLGIHMGCQSIVYTSHAQSLIIINILEAVPVYSNNPSIHPYSFTTASYYIVMVRNTQWEYTRHLNRSVAGYRAKHVLIDWKLEHPKETHADTGRKNSTQNSTMPSNY